MNKKILVSFFLILILALAMLLLRFQKSRLTPDQSLPTGPAPLADVKVETNCTDSIDNDQDGMADNKDGDCWLREGAVFVEDFEPVRTFRNLTDMAPQLKDIGIGTIETLYLWDHIAQDTPQNGHWLRWAVRDFSLLDPERGNETGLADFISSSHDLGLKVVPMFEATVAAASSPVCAGRVIQARPVRYDFANRGGYFYQYQVANPGKKILMKNASGQFVCIPQGWGFAIDQSSPDTISAAEDIYRDQILRRGFDGVRLDVPARDHCITGEIMYTNGNAGYACIDPAIEKHPPMPLYRALGSIKLPSQVFIAEVSDTEAAFSNYSWNYPYYSYSNVTDIDEVAEASEGYEFLKLLTDIMPGKKTSADLVNWVNDEPRLYGRQRFRMIRNWNTVDPKVLEFIAKDARYYPAITLAATIPGIPKVSDYELFGNEEWESKLKINVINAPESRLEYWKKILNIRNFNNALKYGDIKNVWKSGDNIYAYSRTYGKETTIVVINFQNKTAASVLSMPFKSGTILKDSLSGEVFTVTSAENFKISIPAYGSRVLTIIK